MAFSNVTHRCQIKRPKFILNYNIFVVEQSYGNLELNAINKDTQHSFVM